MTLARRAGKAPAGAVFVVDADVLPQTLAVIETRAEPLGVEVRRRRPARATACRTATSSASCCSTRARPARCAT